MGDVAPGAIVDAGKDKKTSLVNEAQFVEGNDGEVRFNVRRWAGKAVRKTCTSADGGVTWSKVEDVPDLVDPGCQASILRLNDGKLLYSGPQSTKRENGTFALSSDGGKTWPVKRVLRKEAFAYSCLVQLADGTLGCLYESDGSKTLVFQRFTLAWLTP
jgi:sialidase-1